MSESLLHKVAICRSETSLKETSCFSMIFAKFSEHLFVERLSGDCFWYFHFKSIYGNMYKFLNPVFVLFCCGLQYISHFYKKLKNDGQYRRKLTILQSLYWWPSDKCLVNLLQSLYCWPSDNCLVKLSSKCLTVIIWIWYVRNIRSIIYTKKSGVKMLSIWTFY